MQKTPPSAATSPSAAAAAVVVEQLDALGALSSAENAVLDSLREDRAHEAAEAILEADHILVATGAG
eukprot:3793751-Prymnesium_polylepis.1